LKMQLSLSAKVIRNVLASGIRALVLLPVPFVMTPLILRKIGVAGYGTWAVFVAFGNLTSLADLGMVGTVSKHVAEYYAHRDLQSLNRLFNTGLVIFSSLSLAVGLLFWFASPIVVRALLKGSPLQVPEVVRLLHLFLIVISANILSLLFASVTAGLQRLDISSWVSAVNVLGSALIGGALILRGWGLRGLVIGQVCSAIATITTYVVVVKHLLPETVLGTRHVNATEARKMFSFSLRLYVTQAAVAVHNQLEKFLLALFVGVSAAGWYDIASDLTIKIRGVLALILGPVLPAASELDARKDQQRLAELYFRAQKYVAFFGLPVVFYVSIVSKKFVQLWLGPNMAFIAVPLTVLLWVNFYNLLTGAGFLIFAGQGSLKPGVQSALLGLILNVGLSVPLIYRFGFAGAVVGTSCSLIAASTFFLYVFHRSTGYSVRRLLHVAFLKPFATAVLVALPGWLVLRSLPASRSVLLVLGFLFAALYVTAIFLNRFLDHYEMGKIESLIPAVRHFRRIIPIAQPRC
jgi:O-antigen/teichoic acid export membrane protein